MEKLVCQKQGHEMPLDMICLNKTCNNKGLLCHKCFINIPHHHMSSEIVHAHKFIENCQTALDQAYEKISHLDDREEEGIREENNASKTMIEECRKKAENITIQLFEGLDKEITSKFEELFNEIEDPKKVVLTDIDKFRTSLKEVQSGLIDDPIDMNKDILSVWQVLEKSKENGFVLKENCSNKNALIQKEEKVNLFKKDSDRIKFVLDRVQEWIKGKPDLKELNQNKPKAKVTPKLLDKPIQKSTEKSVEALRKENEMAGSLAGKKRLNHLDKDEGSKGENPYKKVKSSIMNPLHGEDSKLRRTITPARLESKELNSHLSSFAQPQRRDFEQGLMFKKQEEEKIPKEEVAKKTVSRFTPDDKGYENFRYLHTHAITFKADRDLTMFGFGHYMVFRPTVMAMMEYTLFEGDCADQDDYSTTPPKVLSTGPFQLSKSQGNLKVMEVRLKAPVKIAKNQFYTLKVVNKTKSVDFHCFKGVNGIEKCPPFTFFPSRSSDMAQIYTSVKRGQIPEIIYSMGKND